MLPNIPVVQSHHKIDIHAPELAEAKALVDAVLAKRPAGKISHARYAGAILETFKASKLNAKQVFNKPSVLFEHFGVQRKARLDEAITTSNFGEIISNVALTVPLLFEALHIGDVVAIGSMPQPKSFLVFDEAEYGDGGVYEGGADIVSNVDPTFALLAGECSPARSIQVGNRIEEIEAGKRMLTATLSFEVQQDIPAMFAGASPMARAMQVIYHQLAREWQEAHLAALINDAAHGTTWDATPSGVFVGLAPAQWYETLHSQAVVDLNIQIQNSTDVRGSANQLIGGASALAYLDRMQSVRRLDGYLQYGNGTSGASNDVEAPFVGGLQLVKFETLPQDVLIVQRFDPARPVRWHGMLYGVPSITFPEHLDPTTGCTDVGVASRAGMKTVIPNAAGVITITSGS
jgi:hypothetical protein